LPLLFFLMNLFIIRWAKRSLQQQVRTGAMFYSGQVSGRSAFSLGTLLRRARHWTPSS
jgi:hypothetical protein